MIASPDSQYSPEDPVTSNHEEPIIASTITTEEEAVESVVAVVELESGEELVKKPSTGKASYRKPVPTSVESDTVIIADEKEPAVVEEVKEEEEEIVGEPPADVIERDLVAAELVESEENSAAPEGEAGEDAAQIVEGDIKWYAGLARTFRGSVQRSTVLAFGMKNPLVFTGQNAVDHLQNILKTQDSPADKWDNRKAVMEVLQVLVNDLWLFVPCGIQQRKGWTLKAGEKLSDIDTHMSRSSITIYDDDRNLYRLTKDALILGDISSECFDEFIQWFSNPVCGVKRKEGRLGFRKITVDDGIFSWRTLSDWLENYLGVYAAKEKESIKKLLLSRHVMEKVPFYSCFKFLP